MDDIKLQDIQDASEAVEIDRDKDGNVLYTEDIITYIKDELERRRIERQPFELQWTLNSNFLTGNQHCEINIDSGQIQQTSPLYSWQEHNSYNKIAPLYDTRMALLSTVSYNMTVKPRTSEIDDYRKALVSTELLRFTQDTTDFDAKRIQALSWAELTGTAFWISWWDKDAGEEIVNGKEKIHTGDLRYGLLTSYEVFPESVYKQTIADQRSIIVEQVMSVEDIYDIYGINVEGNTISTYALTPLHAGGGAGYETTILGYEEREAEDSEYVITYYERKSRRYPDGRMAILIGETLIYYGTMPYDTIPITAQKCKDTAGLFYGKSTIEGLVPLQRAYNGVKNKINDYIKNLASNTLTGEEGSIDQDDYYENGVAPGGFLPYREGYQKPTVLDTPELPSVVLQQEQQYTNAMEYFAGVSQLAVTGNTPTGVDSGRAIQNLQKIDNTRISLTGENARNAVKDLAKKWLEIYKKFVKGYRVANIVGINEAGAILTWCSEDINSYDVVFDAENELLVSEESQKENFLAAFQMGLFTDDQGKIDKRFKQKALEMMKIGNYTEILGEGELQKQNARRENAFFEKGVLPQMGLFDDHVVHTNEHKQYVLQMRFHVYENSNPELANTFIQHIHAHEQEIVRAEALAQQQMALRAVQQQPAGGNK